MTTSECDSGSHLADASQQHLVLQHHLADAPQQHLAEALMHQLVEAPQQHLAETPQQLLAVFHTLRKNVLFFGVNYRDTSESQQTSSSWENGQNYLR